MSDSLPTRPSRDTVGDLFRAHLDEHRRLPESARARDLGSEEALVRDYSGRVVYELLQNALDRADRRIVVRWRRGGDGGGLLAVGNDGLAVSAYPRPTDEGVRLSDFHALLSLHSSAKTAQDSIGNKGVGFRSVFSSSPRAVEVWSRSAEGTWWGMGLAHPAKLDPADGVRWTARTAASFYGPRSLDPRAVDSEDSIETWVRLEGVPEEKAGPIEDTIRLLGELPLSFLERRARFKDGRLVVELDGGDGPIARPVQLEEGYAMARASFPVPGRVRRETGLDLETAEVCLLLSPPGTATRKAVYWSYLPTEQGSGHGLHVHGDFYLNNSRRSIAFAQDGAHADPPADPPGWNRWLLEKVADLVVDDLWTRPEVCSRIDFWRLASPNSCACPHLRDAVARRILANPDRFRRLVRAGFAASPAEAGWTVRRYEEFFEALGAWIDFAYEVIRQKQKYKWREQLRGWVRESGAAVLPIVDVTGEDGSAPVLRSRPLPGESRRAPGDERIYLRKTEGFVLPPALVEQRVLVTVFKPDHGGEPSDFGLLDFTRPEVVANLRPGGTPAEHEQLLAVAILLSAEEQERGGRGSILARVQQIAGGPFWRFAEAETALRRAGDALAELHVPVVGGGWEPAHAAVRQASSWPGATRVDEERFSAIAARALDEAKGEVFRPTLDQLTGLFGIGAFPSEVGGDDLPRIAGWERVLGLEEPDLTAAAVAILESWGRDLDPLIGIGAPAARVREQLTGSRWLTGSLASASVAGLAAGPLAEFPLSPSLVWWQRKGRGFRTGLVPRIEQSAERPEAWMERLGIVALPFGGLGAVPAEKVRQAIRLLGRQETEALDSPHDLEQTYARLVESLPDDPEAAELPVLVRRYGKEGRSASVGWRRNDDRVWHDTGEETNALAAFPSYTLWSVRRGPRKLAAALGLIPFEPSAPLVRTEGTEDAPARARLEAYLWRAMPDLMAAAEREGTTAPFETEEVLGRVPLLRVRHVERAWLEYDFDGKKGTLGEDDSGDVFLVPEKDGEPEHLLFDGNRPRVLLVECARPLAEMLFRNRAFLMAFAAGLGAWSHWDGRSDVAPAEVRRFRRERGLGETEVEAWRRRIEARRLRDEDLQEWYRRVRQALESFGPVSGKVEPGTTVRPETWTGDAKGEATQTEVEAALASAFADVADGARIRDTIPLVDFAGSHRAAFRRKLAQPYVAAAAFTHHRPDAWTERLLEELSRIAERETDEAEYEAFRHLRCDVDAVWRRRYGIGPAQSLRQEDLGAAWYFAAGKIPLADLPKGPEAELHLVSLVPGPALAGGRAPLPDEEWIRKARRQATGGRKAQDAVLHLAVGNGESWLRADAPGFWRAVDEALQPFKDYAEVSARIERARSDTATALPRLLDISDYIGNAGFDLLVPRLEEGRVLRVEVKRVASIDGAEFFLSENERRRALELGPTWRLWLVASDGRHRDATAVREHFRRAAGTVEDLLGKGLRPAEWFLRLR